MKKRHHKLFGQAIEVRRERERRIMDVRHFARLQAQLPLYRDIITKLNEEYNFQWWLEYRWDTPQLGMTLGAAKRYSNNQKWQACYFFTNEQTEETLRHAMETLRVAFERSETKYSLV